jgi:predicted transcriptional regulator
MSTTQEDINDLSRPVTIRLDLDLHRAMKKLAKERRVHISYLYQEACEEYLNKAVQKKIPRK